MLRADYINELAKINDYKMIDLWLDKIAIEIKIAILECKTSLSFRIPDSCVDRIVSTLRLMGYNITIMDKTIITISWRNDD